MMFSYEGSSHSYLKTETIHELWTPATEKLKNGEGKYGLGWCVVDNTDVQADSSNVIYHEGRAIGASSVLLIRPNQRGNGVCVAILCNLQECNGLRQLAEEIAHEFTSLQCS